VEQRCPVCGGDLAGGDLLLVCGGCHRMLGNVEVRATGEFMAATPAAIAAAAGDMADEVPMTGSKVCAWCGKKQHEVKKLLTSASVAICNECVALCVDILTAELGDDWIA
jgi:hypothetical protein